MNINLIKLDLIALNFKKNNDDNFESHESKYDVDIEIKGNLMRNKTDESIVKYTMICDLIIADEGTINIIYEAIFKINDLKLKNESCYFDEFNSMLWPYVQQQGDYILHLNSVLKKYRIPFLGDRDE